jgi:hypothetical protein
VRSRWAGIPSPLQDIQFCDDLVLIITISFPHPPPRQFFLHKTFGHFLKEKLDLSQLDIDFKAGIVHLTHLELNNEVTSTYQPTFLFYV